MKRSKRKALRTTTIREITRKYTQDTELLYRGGTRDYEDAADYVRIGADLRWNKAVRLG